MGKVKYNRIKIVLTEQEYKNHELAQFMNVHVSTVSDWCTNSNQPSIPDLFRIAQFLKVDVRELLVATSSDPQTDHHTSKHNQVQHKSPTEKAKK